MRDTVKDSKVTNHDSNPGALDLAGEGVGGVAGAATGAALGSVAGPIGAIIGGIAGAAGGWWTGRTATEAITRGWNDDVDTRYRTLYEKSPARVADRDYETMRPAYQLGYLARANPDYRGKSFEEIESDLERGFTSAGQTGCGDWKTCRSYVREGYISNIGDSMTTGSDRFTTAEAGSRR